MEEVKEEKSLIRTKMNSQNAREHLANERTLLAWIRTSIGIMAFGFVVVKFSLFLKQISLLLGQTDVLPAPPGYSSAIGICLVAVGGLVMLFSYVKFKRTEKQLNNEEYKSSTKLITSLTFIILLISILLIVYLVESTRGY